MPLVTVHECTYVYENKRLFRTPPLLGPPLSCAKLTCAHVDTHTCARTCVESHCCAEQLVSDGGMHVSVYRASDIACGQAHSVARIHSCHVGSCAHRYVSIHAIVTSIVTNSVIH